jgi:hypothetical protein
VIAAYLEAPVIDVPFLVLEGLRFIAAAEPAA